MAVTHVVSQRAYTSGNTVSVSVSSSGSDTYAVIGVFQATDHTLSSVTYGGQSATLLASVGRLSLYGIANPPSGAQTVSAASSASSGFFIGVSVYSGVDSVGTSVTSTNNEETSISVSPVGVADGLLADVAVLIALTMDEGGSQTERIYLPESVHGTGYLSFGMSDRSGVGASPMSWSSDFTVGNNYQIGVPLIPSSSGGPAPTIDDVDGDDIITSTQTGWAVNGSDFDDATVEIRQGAVTIAQTVTGQTATAITCSTVFDAGVGPHLKYGSATLAVINGDAQDDTIAIGILAPSGRSFVDLTTPNPTAANRITAVADLAAGDQLEVSNVQGGTIADVNVNSDATFDVDEDVTAFDVRAWDSSDQTWGAVGTQTVGDIPPPPEPPVFDGTIPNRSFVVNVAIASWDLSTYFTGATSYSSAGTLPTGLTLNASTGVLSGTPSATGTYSGITITGINDDGTDTSNAFTITITDPPPPPGPTKPRRRDGRRRGLLGYIYGRG